MNHNGLAEFSAFDDDSRKKYHEREAMQEKTFRKWINLQLKKVEASPINDVIKDIRDGKKILILLEILTGEKLPREKGRMRIHALNNINRALQVLQDRSVKVSNVNSADIVDGHQKIILSFVWLIIQHFWHSVVDDEVPECRKFTMEQALLRWCRKVTQGYEDVDVRNFTTCWRDGNAFIAIMHKFRPDLIDLDTLKKLTTEEKLRQAFNLADGNFGVKSILDIEDINSDHVDKKSVLTYLMCLFQSIPQSTAQLSFSPSESPVKESDSENSRKSSMPEAKRPKILPEEAQSLAKKSTGDILQDYQSCLEEVLTWLLDAEETLKHMSDVESTELSKIKQQFKEHEDFMVNLTRNQSGIGDVLNKAGALLATDRLNADEKSAIRNQVYMLNDKWEEIRMSAMQRQTNLQEVLMTSQQKQLNDMLKWLSTMDDVLAKTEAPSMDVEILSRQFELYKNLQCEVAKQHSLVSSLANVIIIVDDSLDEHSSFNLEDKLKEVGSRWHDVCQTIDSRLDRLEKLEKLIRFLNESGRHFADWLDQREAALSNFKSAHHLTTSKDVMDQIQNLQIMQQDLESEHPRFIKFSQYSTEAAATLETDNPAGASSIRRTLDEVSQRWENLVCRMDEMTQMVPSISPSSQEDRGQAFDTSFEHFCRWLDKVEANLALSSDDLSKEDQMQSYQEIESDIKNHEPELENLHTKGHDVAERLRIDGDAAEEVESKLHDVNSRWRDLRLVLAERKRKMQICQDIEHFNTELDKMDEYVAALHNWIEKFQVYALTGDLNKTQADLIECQNKLELVKQKEPQVELMHVELTRLLEVENQDNDLRTLQKKFDRFTEMWALVVEKISGALESLSSSLSKSQSPNIEDALASLNSWLDTAEDIIATQDLDSIDNVEITKMKIERLKELQNQLLVQRDTLNFICSTAEELVAEKAIGFEALSVQLVNLTPRWSDIERVLNSQLTRLENGHSKLNEWNLKVADLDKWIDQVTDFVHAEQPAVGNLETLKAQLEQSQGLSADIETLKPKMQQVESAVGDLAPQCTPEMKGYLKSRMDDLDKRWTDVIRLTKAKHDGLRDVHTRSQKIFDDIQQLTTWLTSVEEELNSPVDPATGKDLQLLIKKHKQLKDELESRSNTVEAAVCLGEEMVGSLEGSPEMALQLQVHLNSTRNQWSVICQHVQDKLQHLTDSFEHWRELQELLAAEKICHDQLDKKLNEPTKSASDAEEYSEQLDTLEMLMEGARGHEKLTQIADYLITSNMLTTAVKNELVKYNARRDQLLIPAKERQTFLEAGVHESQEFEQQLLNCQSWIAHVDYILSARLNSDILASDVPQEYKRALASGKLTSQLQTEFDEHDDCLTNLEKQVQKYRHHNKPEAANRLEEQINHVKRQIADTSVKFDKFRKPSNVESMLDRLWKVSKDIEQSTVLLRITSDITADVQAQLEKSRQIHKALIDLKTEIDTIANDDSRKVANPDQLNELYVRNDFLKERIRECENDLQRALDVINRLNDSIESTDAYLNIVEREISQLNQRNKAQLKESSNDVQELLSKVQKQSISFNSESTGLIIEWTELADGDGLSLAVNRVESVKDRLASVEMKIDRLINSFKVKIESSTDRVTLKEEFDAVLYQITLFLGRSESTLTNLEMCLLNDGSYEQGQKELRDLYVEASKHKPAVNRLRDLAVDLMVESDSSAKTDIEKDLSLTNTRWENVYSTMKEHQKKFQIGSRSPTPALCLLAQRSEQSLQSLKSPVQSGSPSSGHVLSPRSAAAAKPVFNFEEATTDIEKPRLTPPMPSPRTKRSTGSGSRPRTSSASLTSGSSISKEPTPDELHTLGSHAALVDSIRESKKLIDLISDKLRKKSVNFDDKQLQIEGTTQTVNDLKIKMDFVKSGGQKLAESGPRELIAQRILEDIDSLAESQQKIEKYIEECKTSLNQMLPIQSCFDEDSEELSEELDRFGLSLETAAHNLDALREKKDELTKRSQTLEKLQCKQKAIRNKITALPIFVGCNDNDDEDLAAASSSAATLKSPSFRDENVKLQLLQTKIQEYETRYQTLKQDIDMRANRLAAFWNSADLLSKMCSTMGVKLESLQMLDKTDNRSTVTQEALFKTIKEHIDVVESNIEKLEQQKDAILAAPQDLIEGLESDPKKIEFAMNSLKEQLTKLNAVYNERVRLYELTLDNWQAFHKNLNSIISYLDQIDEHLSRDDSENSGILQKELEKGFYQKEAELKLINNISDELLKTTNEYDSNLLKEKVDYLNKRFHTTAAQIADRLEKIERKQDRTSELRDDIDELLFWLDESEALLATVTDPTDHEALSDMTDRLNEKTNEFEDKDKKVDSIEQLANNFVKAARVPDHIKEGVLTDVRELKSRLKKLEDDLLGKLIDDQTILRQCGQFWTKFKILASWIESTRAKLEQYNSAIIHSSLRFDCSSIEAEINAKQIEMDDLRLCFQHLEKQADKDEIQVSDRNRRCLLNLTNDYSQVLNLFILLKSSSSSSSDTDSKITTSEDAAGDRHESMAKKEPPSSLYSSIQKDRKKADTKKSKVSKKESSSDVGQNEEDQYYLADDNVTDNSDKLQEKASECKKNNIESSPDQKSKLAEEDALKNLVQLRHWMNDDKREISGSIDISNHILIKDCLKKQQVFADNLQNKKLQLIKIMDTAETSDVQHKAEILSRDWDKCVDGVRERKKELTSMLEESRFWDMQKSELEYWLNATLQNVAGKKVSECTIQELTRELNSIDSLMGAIESYKAKMTELNISSSKLTEKYIDDDTTTVSQETSSLNNKWTKLSDNIRVRRAVLEASLRGRNDFQTAFDEFDAWLSKVEELSDVLDRETTNSQLIKDAAYRKNWMEKEKDYRAELEAHGDIFNSLQDNGSHLIDNLDEKGQDRSKMVDRLKNIDERWVELRRKLDGARQRLEAAQEQWERLTGQLNDLLTWVEEKSEKILEQRGAGGDLARVKRQISFCQTLRREIDEKAPIFEETSKLARSFLIQQDIRSLETAISRMPSDESKLTEDEITKKSSLRIAQRVKLEVDLLTEKWPEFLDHAHRWERIVDNAFMKMSQFDQTLKACDQELSKAELQRKQWKAVKDVKLDDLPNQMEATRNFRHDISTALRRAVDDVNDGSAQLLANDIHVSPELTKVAESLNIRFKQLESTVEQRLSAVESALRDFGPSSQHFLECSILPPWKRAISENRIPYYINLETEKTQWDHPKMVDLVSKLREFNEVRFSAYRTAMKLRAVQKRLFLDLLNLHDAVAIMAQKKLTGANDKIMDIGDIVMALLPMYETIQQNHKDLLKSLPLAIDLCLNWLLNIFDPVRNGILRVLSFKVVLTLMCHATLEDKYKCKQSLFVLLICTVHIDYRVMNFISMENTHIHVVRKTAGLTEVLYLTVTKAVLYRQISTTSGGVDQKKLALLIHDCVQIPKYLGEVAAFGGTNIEPSVRSCFEQAKYPQEINLQNYLDWLKREPQSLVWLPVMHRVLLAEMVKHQSKCNVCKMFPIIGLRYRCLKCFNFDMCQNCFFSQRTAKNHKVMHPMQEYCVASTSGEDVRDFSRIFKNKFKSRKYFKSHPRVGYLPVQSINEGAPIEARNVPPFNPITQELHRNIESFSSHLAEIENSQTLSMGDSIIADDSMALADDEHAAIANLSGTLGVGASGTPILTPQSPAQLISMIDSAQREEFEAIRRRLEDENRRLEIERDNLQVKVMSTTALHMVPNGSAGPQSVMTNGSLGRRSGAVNSAQGCGRHFSATPQRQTTSLQRQTSASPMLDTLTSPSTAVPPLENGFSTLNRSDERAQYPRSFDDAADSEVITAAEEKELLHEARTLRQHKERLEERSRVLENHNEQLEVQLKRLKDLVDQQQINEFNANITSPQMTPYATPGSSLQRGFPPQQNGIRDTTTDLDAIPSAALTASRMTDLMSTVNDLGRAMESFVDAIQSDEEEQVEEGEVLDTKNESETRNLTAMVPEDGASSASTAK